MFKYRVNFRQNERIEDVILRVIFSWHHRCCRTFVHKCSRGRAGSTTCTLFRSLSGSSPQTSSPFLCIFVWLTIVICTNLFEHSIVLALLKIGIEHSFAVLYRHQLKTVRSRLSLGCALSHVRLFARVGMLFIFALCSFQCK